MFWLYSDIFNWFSR